MAKERYGYGSPNNAAPPSQPRFEREIDTFGLNVAQANQDSSIVDSVKQNVGETSQAQNAIMKRNLIDNSMYAQSAQIPEDMPDHMKAIVKATDFDPMSTDSVKQLQMKLNQTGYADSTGEPLKIDGRFGPKTAIAKLGLELDAEDEMNMTMQERQQRAAQEEHLYRQQAPLQDLRGARPNPYEQGMMRTPEQIMEDRAKREWLQRMQNPQPAGQAAPPQQRKGGFGFGSKGQLG